MNWPPSNSINKDWCILIPRRLVKPVSEPKSISVSSSNCSVVYHALNQTFESIMSNWQRSGFYFNRHNACLGISSLDHQRISITFISSWKSHHLRASLKLLLQHGNWCEQPNVHGQFILQMKKKTFQFKKLDKNMFKKSTFHSNFFHCVIISNFINNNCLRRKSTFRIAISVDLNLNWVFLLRSNSSNSQMRPKKNWIKHWE